MFFIQFYRNFKYIHNIFCNIKKKNRENIIHDTIPIYYKNQMHHNYNKDKRIKKEIINKNVKPTVLTTIKN